MEAGQSAVLESIARGADLQYVLNEIVLLIERQTPGMLCSILLLKDGKRLCHGAAPHLPEAYTRAIDGSQIGPTAGSCGTASYTGQRVIVEDIATHPYWTDYRRFALPHGLRSCWSTPIFGPNGEVLGTFAMYYHEPRKPASHELEWVDVATHLASIAILRHRTEQELRRSERRARELTRLHSVASSINKLIVRASSSQNLYELACQIAVEQGLARLAWLGTFDEAKQCIELVAQYGTVAYFDTRTLDLNDPHNRGSPAHLVATAGEPQVKGDLATEGPVYWRAAFAERGLNSCALMPLKDEHERIFGVFALYAQERKYFRDEEMQVLSSLAADISFAVEAARKDLEGQRMQEAVRASENLRALIHSTVADGIFYLQVEEGARYRYLSVNRAFTEIFGAPEEEYVGKVLNDRLPESLREPILERYRHACETRSRVTWEQVFPVRAALKHFEVTIAPIFDATGRCTNVVGSIHDITARVQAEAERTRLVAQLNQAHRMQSLGTLAGGIAHDFNNILAAISGNVVLALQESTLDDTTRTYLNEIQKASHRAIELVRQILTFSRHAPPQRELVDPTEVAREAMKLLRATLSQTIAIEMKLAADTPQFEGDPTQFHQIVMNLVTNAAHALPERGGIIGVKLDRAHLEGSEVAELAAGDYLRLAVSDNGCGMDEATLKRAFDPFFTTRGPGEGTGLGLSVVHGIVQNHQGGIDIRSRVNEGTTVTVYLPAATARGARPAKDGEPRGHGEHVMYVDDEEALVFLMERALRRMGYEVSGFTDPAAALSAFRARPQAFDVLVTDIAMPGISGPDLAIEVRHVRADVPVIMTSGYIRPEDIETAERLHINQLVYKANTIDELGQALAREIGGLSKRRDSSGAAR